MKKFKLLKKYPGVPEDWEIGSIAELEKGFVYTYAVEGSYNYIIGDVNYFSNEEFWEELKPMFVSHDGVNIYNGDKTCVVNLGSNNLIPKMDIYKGILEEYLYFSSLEAAEKYIDEQSKPLFTTEDGEKIFKGDSYYFISVHGILANTAVPQEFDDTYKRFKSKDNALIYIEDCKPKYSIKDIESVMVNSPCIKTITVKKLKELNK